MYTTCTIGIFDFSSTQTQNRRDSSEKIHEKLTY